MTEQKKRRRRVRGGSASTVPSAPGASAIAAASGRATPNFPVWRWRTFPVYFALTGGLFVGLYLGIAVGALATEYDNETPMTALLVIAALAFGFALSRVTSRFMVSRGIFRPKSKQSKT